MFTNFQLESIVLYWKHKQTNVTHNPHNYLDLVWVSDEAIHEESVEQVIQILNDNCCCNCSTEYNTNLKTVGCLNIEDFCNESTLTVA